MNEIQEALLSMGYREIEKGKWAKPVGYHLFTFAEATNLWDNWFLGTNDTLLLWHSEEIASGDSPFISTLKDIEAYTRINVSSSHMSKFQFLTLQQQIEHL